MYIGQALNLSIRIIQHINGNKSNVLLQRAINKYGISSFEFLVVEFVADTSLLTTREQLHLDWLFSLSSESRYNICPTAESRLGTTHTAETKALMSKSQQLVDRSGENHPIHGKTHTAETKAAISAALTGKTHTSDSKALMSERQLGNTNRLGKTHTAESKAAIGAALLGNTNCVGRTLSAESIDQIRLNQPSRISVFVYDQDNKLVVGFPTQVTAAEFLKVSRGTVQNYLASGKVLKEKYILRSSPFS